jgi:Kef-type K+ transport system membrane component KefB
MEWAGSVIGATGTLGDLLIQLLAIFAAAMLGGELAQRLKMPAVVGEILMGVAIGPSALNLVPFTDGHPPAPFALLAEVGVVFLMFSVGLETQLSSLKAVGRVAAAVAVMGVVVPFALGMAYGYSMGYAIPKQAFIATALVATSVGITARVLADLNLLQRVESKIILAAAVLDDILAMLALAVVIALNQVGGAGAVTHLAVLGGQALLFVLMMTLFLPKLVRRHHRVIDKPLLTPHSPFALSILLCLCLAVLAGEIGLAGIIGAFMAGVVLSEISERYSLEHQLRPLLYFLSPFFFVVTGMQVDTAVFADWRTVVAALVVTVIAVIGKVVGCGAGAWRLGKRKALAIGIGMVPRGEVGIIIAALGLSSGAFSKDVYGIVIAMSLLTSIIAPPFLVIALQRSRAPETLPSQEARRDPSSREGSE